MEEAVSLLRPEQEPAAPRTSLARRSGSLASTVVTLLALACHAGFAFAQLTGSSQTKPFQPMAAGLFQATIDARVNFTTNGFLTPAFVAYRLATCMGAETDCDAETQDIDVCSTLSCGRTQLSKPVLQFSYAFSLRDLWAMPCGIEARECDRPRDGRAAALFLFLASFVWPHLKLVCLLFAFHAPLAARTRRTINHALAALGKWSFADVLVLSVMMGVLNLHVDHGLDGDVARPFAPALLSYLPSAVLSSDDLRAHVDARLHISGMPGMYAFCVAVVASLLLGVLVEVLDARGAGASAAAATPAAATVSSATAASAAATAAAAPPPDAAATAATDGGPRGGARRMVPSTVSARRLRARQLGHAALVACTLAALVGSVRAPLFSRRVTGSLPALLAAQGVRFDGDYSVLQLHALVVAEGGLNHLMAATFVALLVVGPVLRCCSLLWLLLAAPSCMSLRARRLLHGWSRHCSVFFAMEVLLVAVPLIALTFGPTSRHLLTPHSFAPCVALNAQFETPTCLEVEVSAARSVGFWLMGATVALYLLTGFDGSPTHRFVHVQLYPPPKAKEPPVAAAFAGPRGPSTLELPCNV